MRLFPSLYGYESSFLRPDGIAGLTVWALLVPECLAYAVIAGLPPAHGLYAAAPALVLYAAFGSSRHLIVGPMSVTAAMSAGIVGTFVAKDGGDFITESAALAIVTGTIFVIAGAARLGFLSTFISEPVLKGFTFGLALTIAMDQIPDLLGTKDTEGTFFERLWHAASRVDEIHPMTAVIGVGSLAMIVVLQRVAHRIPASLTVVAVGIVLANVLDLPGRGVEVVGPIPSGLPVPDVPAVQREDYLPLAGGAAALTLVGFAEGIAAAKNYARRAGYKVDADRELRAVGASNIGAGLMAGMVVNGSLSKTAVNGEAGGRTQASGLLAAALVVVTLLFLTGVFQNLPEATLAAVVIAAVMQLVDPPALRRYYHVWSMRLKRIYGPVARSDFHAAMAAMFGVLLLGTLPGLLIGIGVSLLLLLQRASRPHVAELRPTGPNGEWHEVLPASGAERDREVAAGEAGDDGGGPPVVVVRVESGLFFTNAEHVKAEVERFAGNRGAVGAVIDCRSTPFIDITAAEVLVALAEELARNGGSLVLLGTSGQVRDVIDALTGTDLLIVAEGMDEAVSRAARPPQIPSE